MTYGVLQSPLKEGMQKFPVPKASLWENPLWPVPTYSGRGAGPVECHKVAPEVSGIPRGQGRRCTAYVAKRGLPKF